MAVLKGLEWTFDTVASTYEKFRPGYVAKIEDTIKHHGGTITIYDTIDLQLARKP